MCKLNRYLKVAFIMLVLLAVPAFVFAGGQKETKGKVTLSLMKYADETDLGKNPEGYKGPSDKLIAEFMEKNPNIEVKPIYLNEKYSTTYAIKLAAGEAPDVVWMGGAFLSFAGKGAFLNINDRIKSDKSLNLDGIFPKALDMYKYKGDLYGVPDAVTTNVVVYNKTMFDKAGMAYPKDNWTMDEMVNKAKKLTKDIDGNGVNDQWGIADWDKNGQTSLLYGGPMFNKEGTKVLIDRPITRAMLQIWYNMIFKYKVHPLPAESKTLFGSGSFRAFKSGKVAMSGFAAWGRLPVRTVKDFDWDVVMYPNYKGKIGGYMSGEAYLISASTKHPDEAYKLLKFTTTKEWETLQTASGSSIPSLKALANSNFFLEPQKKPKNAAAFLEMIKYGTLPWASPAGREIRRAYNANVQRLLLPIGDKDKITSIDKFMKLATAAMQKVLDDYNAGK
ncbi:MAG: sugar ABC transporter substrate-binding protein [Spirochaetes bacterium]|nr:sugar ABC transporter substrate-binding protein [Spirochaetota bacterium]